MRLAPPIFFTPRAWADVLFLIACASSSTTIDQVDLGEPFLPPQHAVGRNHQVELRQCGRRIAGDASQVIGVGLRAMCEEHSQRRSRSGPALARQLPINEAGTTNKLGPGRPARPPRSATRPVPR